MASTTTVRVFYYPSQARLNGCDDSYLLGEEDKINARRMYRECLYAHVADVIFPVPAPQTEQDASSSSVKRHPLDRTFAFLQNIDYSWWDVAKSPREQQQQRIGPVTIVPGQRSPALGDGNRPQGQRSSSVGDIYFIDGEAYLVAGIGFKRLGLGENEPEWIKTLDDLILAWKRYDSPLPAALGARSWAWKDCHRRSDLFKEHHKNNPEAMAAYAKADKKYDFSCGYM